MPEYYTDEFKQEIVSLRRSGKSVKEICETYELGKNTVRQWELKYDPTCVSLRKTKSSDSTKLTKAERKLKSMEKKVQQLEEKVVLIQHAFSSLLKKKP